MNQTNFVLNLNVYLIINRSSEMTAQEEESVFL